MTTPRRRGLGRGLDALLGESAPAAPAPSVGTGVRDAGISQLRPNRHQPRESFDEESLGQLADSIRAQGILQPIVVVEEEPGWFTIVAGERRWRAARLAGLDRVPVVVREAGSESSWLELALVENLQRSDLGPIEEAEAYQELRDRFGLTQELIATRVGKSRATVTNTLRLLRLPEAVLALLRSGTLSAGQARPLLALDDPRRQAELAREAVERGFSAREIEALVGDGASRAKPQRKGQPSADANTQAAQERLTRALQTRVEIRRRGKAGTVRIHFHSEDELMRLYDHLVGGKETKR
ncbi:MAG TPA: ParB/RepB/Spo0J family partition protein [Thermoanaerobaculia bacterium]|nr:ParB/RepB/Spo0J family partition protein [Thermoanaerobaculia bacterium]